MWWNRITEVNLEPIEHGVQRRKLNLSKSESICIRSEEFVSRFSSQVRKKELSGILSTSRENISEIRDYEGVLGKILTESVRVVSLFESEDYPRFPASLPRRNLWCSTCGLEPLWQIQPAEWCIWQGFHRDLQTLHCLCAALFRDQRRASFCSPQREHADRPHRWPSKWQPNC